jgi:DNA invertase Pin-like site-specific DNA recombinase
MARAWGYCRVSSAHQAESGSSLAAQSQAIMRFADYQGFDLGPDVERDFGTHDKLLTRSRVLCEDPVSGWKVPFVKRKVAGDLLPELRNGDCLVVNKLDRLGRNLRDIVNTVHMLDARDVSVYVLDVSKDPVNGTKGPGRTLLHLFALIAEFESDRRSERVKDAVAMRRSSGLACGPPPILMTRTPQIDDPHEGALTGSKKKKKEVRLVPCKFNVARAKIFYDAHCTEGLYLHAMVQAAEDNGLRSREGKQYNPKSIQRLIRAWHQVRKLAAELGLPDDDEAVIFAWWQRHSHEGRNLRATIPPDCKLNGREAFRRHSKDDQFRSRSQRPFSPLAIAQHNAAIVRRLVQKYQP